MDFHKLESESRLLFSAPLEPAAGRRFQPTGFADLGAAEYSLPDGTQMLLVESAQSVANRLEKTCLDGDGPDADPQLAGLPYVTATLEGTQPAVRTSSLIEAHRLGSPYFLLNKKFSDALRAEMNYSPKRPLDWPKIYATFFKYDPNCLIHGVFLSLLEGGRVRAARALTGFIEAEDVRRVVSGGVKNSSVDPKGELQVTDAKAGEKGVYSNVPYSRIEFVARQITAYFNLDLSLIRGYRLPSGAANLLIALALLKVRRFLDAHLRLRTACDFRVAGAIVASRPSGFELPEEPELLAGVKDGIAACRPFFAEPAITELITRVKVVAEKGEKKESVAEEPTA